MSFRSSRHPGAGPLWLAFALTGVLACSAEAGQQGVSSQSRPDFMLRPPYGSISVRGSRNIVRGGSDWYDFVTTELTLGRGDFDSTGIGSDLTIAITPRLSFVGGFDYNQTTADSEYRDYLDNDRLPIVQRTKLRQMHVTAGVRVALLPPGRRIGQFVWIPRRIRPYAGAGAGILKYELQQEGDFVDFVDLSIFRSRFQSQGWVPSGHVFGGTSIQLRGRFSAMVEARYVFARATLGRAWIDFEPLDLSGLRMASGLEVLF